MFSFHKPRVYRSTEGCCICRAKSSSSRFTDSRKYESDSMKCFDLKYPRHGEICNACVLLVKRYKRLPVGSTRHWGHVVDARAGPGTKSMSKHKKNRDDSGEQCSTNTGNNNNSLNSSNNNNGNGGQASRRTQNSKSLIPEKFSKIFKKSKKNKSPGTTTATVSATCGKREVGVKRRSTGASANAQSWDSHSLPTTPDSLDSDYEDGGRSAVSSNGAIVQFQTQTRASSYRSRNATAAGINSSNSGGGNNVSVQRKRLLQLGSKRRKVLSPRKYRRTNADEQSVDFFDKLEWQERKSCCGIVYECEELGGALLLDLECYRPCVEHGPTKVQEQQASQTQHSIATLPVMTPPTTSSVAVASPSPPAIVFSANPTPALKKHHLFFKRQSECFPHGDLNMHNTELKTESTAPAITSNNHSSITTTNAIVESAIVQPGGAVVACSSAAASLLSINTAHISATAQMPRHSTAKITTISPPITINSSSNNNNNNSSNGNNNSACNKLIHKIKAGKIFKNSLEKISGGVVDRIKCSSEGPELKNMVRAVHKSYVLAKPNNSVSTNGSNSGNTTSNGLPNNAACTTSSAPKFSDNSSDSGFDENMQDRKSASPLQEDTERKMATRNPMGNVHTMFLANGIQIHGQPQNLLLAGTEAAARMLQKRNQAITTNKAISNLLQSGATQYQPQQSNARINVSSAAVKIVGTPNNNNVSSAATGAAVTIGGAGLLGSHTKPSVAVAAATRAIYNNNTIQHENGVTTILPASSLAASTQTAAMNALAPSTVTITPAPTHHLSNSINKKLQATTNGNNQSNNIVQSVVSGATHITNNNNSKNNHHLTTHHAPTALNQKIILLKTAPSVTKYSNNTSGNSAKAAVAGVSAISTGAVVPSVTLSNLSASACKN